MNDPIREAFEEVCFPSFGSIVDGLNRYASGVDGLNRYASGEYINPTLEDHWNTFQEGWEAALEFLKNKSGTYSDIMATGGFDPRS